MKDELLCRRCQEVLDSGIVSTEFGRIAGATALCTACIAAEADTADHEPKQRDSVNYGMFTVLASETWPQYLRRVFPELAAAMYDDPTTPRDHEMFRLGFQIAFAEETWARQHPFERRRTPQQVVEEFFRTLKLDRPAGGGPTDERP
jgi:hypothetical protein